MHLLQDNRGSLWIDLPQVPWELVLPRKYGNFREPHNHPKFDKVLNVCRCLGSMQLAQFRAAMLAFPDIPRDHFPVADDSFRMQN